MTGFWFWFWSDGIPAPPQQVSPPPQQEAPPPPLDLEGAGSPEDLEAAGLDQLKEALRSRGLKCGGTLQERACRLFSVRVDPLLRPTTSQRKRRRDASQPRLLFTFK